MLDFIIHYEKGKQKISKNAILILRIYTECHEYNIYTPTKKTRIINHIFGFMHIRKIRL